MIGMDSLLLLVVAIVAIFFIGSFARILREYERAVIFRLGRTAKAILNPGGQGNGPGLVLLVPIIDKMVKVSMQTVALDVAPQDVITRDNVSLKVSAVIYFRVVDPERAVVQGEPVEPGAQVRILAVDGLTLKVAKAEAKGGVT